MLKMYHFTFRRLCRTFRVGPDRYSNCEATVKLEIKRKEAYVVAEGDGPVNALDAALRKALRPVYPQIDEIALVDYKVRIINGQAGTAAKTRVFIVSSDGETSWGTVGVSDNIIDASWLALVDSFEYKLRRAD